MGGGDRVTVGQVIVILSLLAQTYLVNPAAMQCMIQRESDYNVSAVNGPCVGLAQWHPDTRQWLGEKARGDPAWLHGDIGEGDVYDLALMAWALKNGYKDHWQVTPLCEGKALERWEEEHAKGN